MPKLIVVMGTGGCGKSTFIKNHFSDMDAVFLDVFDYQQRAYDESGNKGRMTFDKEYQCLYKANEDLLQEVLSYLSQGRSVVAEHTFYKAKRRIVYLDEIRKLPDVSVEFYVICADGRDPFRFVEFPNPAEGIDRIYEVTESGVRLRMDPPCPQMVDTARREIQEEKECMRREREEKERRLRLLKSMKTRPFWHYCEVCGKKEYITADDAFEKGWYYPPGLCTFGMLGPRTCGNCGIDKTLYWKIQMKSRIPIVIESCLTPEELITWRRIKAEPESLLDLP